MLLRKGLLTSWQLERVRKGENTGFFYGGCKVLFHLAEGTFARVYRGLHHVTDVVAGAVLGVGAVLTSLVVVLDEQEWPRHPAAADRPDDREHAVPG